ncbi:hypothetical protein [Sphingobacterium tabacisoli]|uniref:Uncharacterized protein n=1 Tax=Sphingobacterium tabacisoli TaxID=2044855 RepID=A0ABW5L176_9SPHI|nr:hypothetical protein [Sphingobacterium tabacisoli]
MNKTIYFLLLTVCFGCKVNKEKSERLQEDRQARSSLESTTSWTQFNSQDSSLRYWYYRGDSTFFFHPDLGLWSRSGELAYSEQRAVQRRVTGIAQHYDYDSLGTESNKIASQSNSKMSGSPVKGWLWFLVLILVAFLIYRWRK